MGSTRTRSLWSYSCDPGRLLRVSEGAIRKAGLAVPLEERDRYGGFRPTPEVIEAWERTRAVALTLEAPIVVFQCPASFTPTLEHIAHLRTFFERVERAGLLFAWEPRGNWPEETVAALCRDLDLIHCVDPFAGRHGRGRALGQGQALPLPVWPISACTASAATVTGIPMLIWTGCWSGAAPLRLPMFSSTTSRCGTMPCASGSALVVARCPKRKRCQGRGRSAKAPGQSLRSPAVRSPRRGRG